MAHWNDPEYGSVLEFVEYLLDDDRDQFTYQDLQALHYRLNRPLRGIKAELISWGLTLAERPFERAHRGFTANCHNRWAGNPCASGSGWDSIIGMNLT